MLKKIIFALVAVFFLFACEQPTTEITKEVTTVNNVSIVWKGALPSAPSSPSVGWAYYDTTQNTSFIWNGSKWEILAQDGVSIIWKGSLPSEPSNPKVGWAYYNIVDGNSYIYNGNEWGLLEKSGRDGAAGILLWLGTLPSAPSNPNAGWAYHNSADGVSYIYDGNAWQILVRDGIIWKGVSSSAPANPEINWAYYNSSSSKSYIWNGSSWEVMAESGNANITVPITWKGSLTAAPANPQIGWMYYNSAQGKSYIWDGTSWNIVAQDGSGQIGQGGTPEGFLITWKGGLANAPSDPQKGWAYYDTSEKKSFIWDGSEWQILAQDGTGSSGGTQGPWLYVYLTTKEGNYQQYNQTTLTTANFGKVGVGSFSRSTTFYLYIQGGTNNTTLNLTGEPPIQISGEDADCFSVIQPSITTTDSGNYYNTGASIAFNPNSIGIKTATITIPNDSPDKPDFSFTVTGEGSIWPKTFDGGEGDGQDQITCSLIDNSGNIYFIGWGFELVNHHSNYDWWIKKFDSSGNEITSGWDKKIDLNDSSIIYDKPTKAVIDSNNNLYVTDGYYILKFAPDGTEITSGWRKKLTNMTTVSLYVDSQNNVFTTVTNSSITKYNPSGTQLWAKSYGGELAFDSSDNIAVYSSNSLRYILADGTEKWTNSFISSSVNITYENDWYKSSISASSYEYWEFDVTEGNTYRVSWNQYSQTYSSSSANYYYGDGTMFATISASAYWKDDSSNYIFSNVGNGWGSPQSITATKSGTIVVRFLANASGGGTYAIRCLDSSNTPLNIKRRPTSNNTAYSVNSAVFDNNGYLYVAGYATNYIDNYSKKDAWIRKYDSSTGSYSSSGWDKYYDWGHSDDESATKILIDGTNVIVVGIGDDLINGASKSNGWVKRLDTSGNELFSFIIPDGNASIVKYDGNYWITSGTSAYNLALRKYNASGALIASFNHLSSYVYYPIFTIDSNNNVYVSGMGQNLVTSVSSYDWIIKKYDSMGVEQ